MSGTQIGGPKEWRQVIVTPNGFREHAQCVPPLPPQTLSPTSTSQAGSPLVAQSTEYTNPCPRDTWSPRGIQHPGLL